MSNEAGVKSLFGHSSGPAAGPVNGDLLGEIRWLRSMSRARNDSMLPSSHLRLRPQRLGIPANVVGGATEPDMELPAGGDSKPQGVCPAMPSHGGTCPRQGSGFHPKSEGGDEQEGIPISRRACQIFCGDQQIEKEQTSQSSAGPKQWFVQ